MITIPKNKEETKFIIREAKEKDTNDLIANYYSRYEEIKRNPSLGLEFHQNKPTREEQLKYYMNWFNEIKNGNIVASVAEADGHVVGICSIHNTNPQIEKKHIGTLGIRINEDYRSHGIGTALMIDTLRKAKGRFKIVDLEVFGINETAIKLYEKMGFKIYGVHPEGLLREGKTIPNIFMYIKI